MRRYNPMITCPDYNLLIIYLCVNQRRLHIQFVDVRIPKKQNF